MTKYFAPSSSIFITLFVGIICCLSSSRSTPSYYQRRQVSVFTRHSRPEQQEFLSMENGGNECPETEPWPCQTAGKCLSFDFVCDGQPHCDDGFDERPVMCRAKKRPAKTIFEQFIRRHYAEVTPLLFGYNPPSEIAKWLTEAKNIDEFAQVMNLTNQQYKLLNLLTQNAYIGRYIDIALMDFSRSMTEHFQYLFGRLAKSGFVRDPDTGKWL